MAADERHIRSTPPGPFMAFLAGQPRTFALLGAVVAWVEITANHLAFFQASFWPSVLQPYANVVAVLTAVITTAATFVVLLYVIRVGAADLYHHFLMDDRVRHGLKLAVAIVIANLAFHVGVAITALVFREAGPFGAVVEGLLGPRLPVDAAWWPAIFILSSATAAWGLAGVWRQIRDEAIIIAQAAANKADVLR